MRALGQSLTAPVLFYFILFNSFQGIDLTKSTLMALADQGNGGKIQGETNPLTSIVTAIPNQGMLQPYEKIPIFFRFSPR